MSSLADPALLPPRADAAGLLPPRADVAGPLPPRADGTGWPPRLYAVYRQYDVTGVSGTGLIMFAVEWWPDGAVTSWWATGRPPAGYDLPVHQVTDWPDLRGLVAVHGHGGSTVLLPADFGAPGAPECLSGRGIRAVAWPDGRCTTALLDADGGFQLAFWSSRSTLRRGAHPGSP